MSRRSYIPWIFENFIWFILIGILILFSLISDRFLTPTNLINILVHASVLGIMVIGKTFILITRKLDLSMESTLGLAAMIGVWLIVPSGPPSWGSGWLVHPLLAILVMLLLGVAIGWINGALITYGKMNDFVVTLAMLIILRGAVLIINNGQTVSGAPSLFNWLGSANLGPVPISVVIMLAAFAAAHVVTRYHPFGRELYAVGGNHLAALASGIDPDKRIRQVYMISGALAAFSGLILAGQVQAVPSNLGEHMIFEVFAAAVIGGISLQGGRGSMIGALGGVLLLSAIDSGLNLMRVSNFWIESIRGMIILIAMFIEAQKVRYRVPRAESKLVVAEEGTVRDATQATGLRRG